MVPKIALRVLAVHYPERLPVNVNPPCAADAHAARAVVADAQADALLAADGGLERAAAPRRGARVLGARGLRGRPAGRIGKSKTKANGKICDGEFWSG